MHLWIPQNLLKKKKKLNKIIFPRIKIEEPENVWFIIK